MYLPYCAGASLGSWVPSAVYGKQYEVTVNYLTLAYNGTFYGKAENNKKWQSKEKIVKGEELLEEIWKLYKKELNSSLDSTKLEGDFGSYKNKMLVGQVISTKPLLLPIDDQAIDLDENKVIHVYLRKNSELDSLWKQKYAGDATYKDRMDCMKEKFAFERLATAGDNPFPYSIDEKDLPEGLGWDEKIGILFVACVVLGMTYSFCLELQDESLQATVEASKVKKSNRYETLEEPTVKKKKFDKRYRKVNQDNSIEEGKTYKVR